MNQSLIPSRVVNRSFLSIHPSHEILSFKRPLNSAVPLPFFSKPDIRNSHRDLLTTCGAKANSVSNLWLEFGQFTIVWNPSFLSSCHCTIYTMSLNQKIRSDTTKCYKRTLFVATPTWIQRFKPFHGNWLLKIYAILESFEQHAPTQVKPNRLLGWK